MRAILVLGPMVLLAACNSPDRFESEAAAVAAERQAQLAARQTGSFAVPTTVPYGLSVASPYGLPPTTPGGIGSADLAAAGIGVAPNGAPVPVATLGAPPPPGVTPAGAMAPAPGGFLAVPSSGVAGDVNLLRPSGLEASPANAAPTLVGATPVATANPTVPMTAGTGISDEQDFEAVASRESIESDAARRAAQAAQYQVVQPSALPPAPADTGPNIVEYALAAPNAKGQEWYSRFVFSGEGRQLRNCAGYASPDEAQRDFLARGGPERDPRGLDPDGDGFACAWDPAPFRAAVAG